LEGDGNLALFVGGRVMPAKYPQPVSSRIFRHRNGKFEIDAPNSKMLENIGMVSGAVWSDLDGDGFPELLLACEWGPIRIFHNNHGKLSEANFALSISALGSIKHQPSTFNQLTGWWNGIATADLDGDGRMD